MKGDTQTVLAVDLSLNSTGLCLDGECSLLKGLKPAAGNLQHRLAYIEQRFVDLLELHDVDVIVKEAPIMHHANRNGAVGLLMAHGVLSSVASRHDIQIVEVAPSELKRFATGSGRATKDQMIMAAQQWGYGGTQNDEADAFLVWSWYQNAWSTTSP